VNPAQIALRPANETGASAPVNILIVDDEPKNLVVLETVLDDPGYRLVRATSGQDALLELMSEEFAVLVLDVRMPGMTGFELAEMVKERRKTSRIPIIFLTAYYNEDQHILEGYETGAVDYLHKPINPTVLRSKVAVFAELHRRGRALEMANQLLTREVSERSLAEARLNELNATLDRHVTERTLKLQEIQARLVAEHRRKDEFLATLAHELRNPLAPVRTAIGLLRRGIEDPNKLKWAYDMMDRQVKALARLIDDLMDVSRINQGRIELRREAVAVGDVLNDAVETVRPLIEELGHALSIEVRDAEAAVQGDRTRLAQAFVNLLSNAAKYTDRGGRIEVVAAVEDHAVSITVLDNGIGISPDRIHEVFEMFAQVDSRLDRIRGGLGIGLALTKRLVEMHGGEVLAHSKGLGCGSKFEVRLPLSAIVPSLEASDVQAERTGNGCLRILIADDNRDAAEALAVYLQDCGHRVRHVHDGEAALALAIGFDPQVVLLDIGMPKLNGYDTCRMLRARPNGNVIAIFAVSGWGQAEDLARSQAAGFDRHFVKPIEMNEVLVAIRERLNHEPGTLPSGL
jgi:signal transduction histidine kinase